MEEGEGELGCVFLKSKGKRTKRGGLSNLPPFFQTFFMTCKYFYCYRIYICLCKNIVIFEMGWGNSLEQAYVEGEQVSNLK